MTEQSNLYRQTRVRVGPEHMRGVDRLLEEGHTGIAEKHTVAKLIAYVNYLEGQLGIHVDPDEMTEVFAN
jgi:hypothetical protein